jgi:hypothetical protein
MPAYTALPEAMPAIFNGMHGHTRQSEDGDIPGSPANPTDERPLAPSWDKQRHRKRVPRVVNLSHYGAR